MFRWYQEPFFHFIILGAILFFIIDRDSSKNNEEESRVIVAKQEDISKVLNYWNRDHNSTPTDKELDKLLKEYMQDEILYREALRKNLDKDDVGIKKILVDKLKYTLSDSLNISEVSTDVLEEYFKNNLNKFNNDSQVNITFGQIYINPQEHDNIDVFSKQLLNEVNSSAYSKNISKKGDKFYAGNYFNGLTKRELSKSFSRAFVNHLVKLPSKKWSILKSGYGVHLIYIVDITRNKIKFEDIKERVKDKYIIESNRNAYKKFYEEIKDTYTIIIDNNKSKNGIK